MVTIYASPLWTDATVESLDWVSAYEATSAPAMHAISSDRDSTTIASGIVEATTQFQMRNFAGVEADAIFLRWGEQAIPGSYPTGLKLYTRISDSPGTETEVTYTAVYSQDGAYLVNSGVRSSYYGDAGSALVTFEATPTGYDTFYMEFIGSGTFYLNGFFPLRSLDLMGPVYASQQEVFNTTATYERTLSGKLKSSAKGLTIKSKFSIVYEMIDRDELDALIDLYRDTRGGMFPFGMLFHSKPYIVRFEAPVSYSEEEAGLFNVSLDLEEI